MSGDLTGEAFGAASISAALDGRYDSFENLEARSGTLIYRARQRSTGRRVVVKLLMNDRVAADSPPPEEVRALAALSWHSNVVTLIEAGTTPDGIPFIVTDYLSGGTLGDVRVEDGDATTIDRVLDIVAQVASALAAAHRLGIVHCDVKPSNIWLASDGTARLGDFGIARMLEHTAPTLEDVRGTVHFVAPEVLDGGQPSAASDVFALGRTIAAVIEGDLDRSDNFLTAVARDMQSSAARFSRLRTHLAHDPRTAQLLESTVHPEPSRRPQAADVADALVERPRTGSAATSTSSGGWRRPAPKQVRTVAMMAAGALLVATGFIVGTGDDPGAPDTVATVADLCSAAADAVEAQNDFIDSLPERLSSTENSYDLLHYLIREVPRQLARRAEPLVETARRLPSTRRAAEELSSGSLERLILADGIYAVTRDEFIIGPHADVDRTTVPAIIRSEALAWDALSDLARDQCELPPETTQKASVGSLMRERLRQDGLQDLFVDERSFDLFDDQFVMLMVDLAPGEVEQQFIEHPTWTIQFFQRNEELRNLFIAQDPELLLRAAKRSPDLIDRIQLEHGDWVTRLGDAIGALDAFRRENLIALYRDQIIDLGVQVEGA